ncbi:MAG TPA: TPM domain-containing protein [Syntrophorhabdaceae bacterium]|jgi:putative membrane protein
MRHPVKADKFFTAKEKEKIQRTATHAEAGTIGQIAVAIVDQSSQYREAELLGSIFLGSALSLALTTIFFHGSVWFFIPMAFLFFFPFHLLFKAAPMLKAVFAGPGRMAKAVRERAIRTFYEKGLYKTKESTGVLFFLSLLERKVWVLADKGIHGKIHQPTLNKLADMVSRGIQAGRASDALCEAIAEMGALLAAHYPAKGVPVDELPDEIICEPGATCDTE